MSKTLQTYLETLATFAVSGKHFAVDMDNNLYATDYRLTLLRPSDIADVSEDRYTTAPMALETEMLFNCIDGLGDEYLLVSGARDVEVLASERNDYLFLDVIVTFFRLNGMPYIVVYDGEVPVFYCVEENLKTWSLLEPYTNPYTYTPHAIYHTYREAQDARNRLLRVDRNLSLRIEETEVNPFNVQFKDLPLDTYFVTNDNMRTLMQKIGPTRAVADRSFEMQIMSFKMVRPLDQGIVDAIDETTNEDNFINWPEVWRLL